ncbi:Bbp16 family capsid cement protein [Basilea psittacipulmonis]|uniref:Uncharacterized protein n=1 Tax=Basilea psittacipulmonis DSM 24701 TaxID=1072685 RepID=A0A077DEF0_9BURK|nr:hypothetical protein [Basilea psittacipulmonis]AIL33099.1 hypothetical protein IX83_07080 [Basilea psittacipulmonis DSM 24701]
MAIIDSRLVFSDKQNATANGVSTNTIDLGSDRNIGVGTPLYAVVQLVSNASSAITVALESSKTENGTYDTLGSIVIPAGAKAGNAYSFGVPNQNNRYLRLKYGAVCQVTSYLSLAQPASHTAYPAT